MAEEEKKIIIDEDWKQQAQKEKEILAAQEKTEKKKEGVKAQRGPLPPGDFAALVSMLVTQAFFSLGVLKIEGQGDKEPDFELAKYNIDMLDTLQEKTKNNLSNQEQKVLEDSLHQLRMTYVQLSKQ
jgi:hypothetical protein